MYSSGVHVLTSASGINFLFIGVSKVTLQEVPRSKHSCIKLCCTTGCYVINKNSTQQNFCKASPTVCWSPSMKIRSAAYFHSSQVQPKTLIRNSAVSRSDYSRQNSDGGRARRKTTVWPRQTLAQLVHCSFCHTIAQHTWQRECRFNTNLHHFWGHINIIVLSLFSSAPACKLHPHFKRQTWYTYRIITSNEFHPLKMSALEVTWGSSKGSLCPCKSEQSPFFQMFGCKMTGDGGCPYTLLPHQIGILVQYYEKMCKSWHSCKSSFAMP